jgi:hypothetical protein
MYLSKEKEAMSYGAGKFYVEASPEYLLEASSLLSTRCKQLDVNLAALMTSLGKRAKRLYMVPSEEDDHGSLAYASSAAGFFTEFAVLVEFLYPVLEQLETSVSKHVRFIGVPDDWEE